MSEILIKGMEMPTRCGKCNLRTYCRNKEGNMVTVCSRLKREIPSLNLDEVRMADCPLVELPPHGRLIDADAFKKYCETGLELINRELHGDALKMATAVTESFCKDIDEAPTVLEASK